MSERFDQPGCCPVCFDRLMAHLRGVTDSVTGREFDVLKCPACGMGITNPPPDPVQPYYAGYYGSRHSITARLCARRRMSLVNNLAGPGRGRRLLDIGCGDGTFLEVCRKRGWQAVGTELNADPARRRGFEVFSNLDECPARGPFDCVTLWHSLEHMPDPRAVIAKVRELVADDGYMFIAVPDFEGLQSKTFGSRWLHLDVPRHLYHFTTASMDRMLEQAEFVPVTHWHQEFEYDLIGWWQSALNAVLPTPNVLFDYLSQKKLRGTLFDRIVSGISAPFLSLAFLPLVWLGSMTKQGGTLLVAAQTNRRQIAGVAGD